MTLGGGIAVGTGLGSFFICLTVFIINRFPRAQVVQDVTPSVLDFLSENTKAIVNLDKTFTKSIEQFDRTHTKVNNIEKVAERNSERIDLAIKEMEEIKTTTSGTNSTVTEIRTTQGLIAGKILK